MGRTFLKHFQSLDIHLTVYQVHFLHYSKTTAVSNDFRENNIRPKQQNHRDKV